MMEEIKACPMCGRGAEITTVEMWQLNEVRYMPKCHNEECLLNKIHEMTSDEFYFDECYKSYDEAGEAWNTRQSIQISEVEKVIEDLESGLRHEQQRNEIAKDEVTRGRAIGVSYCLEFLKQRLIKKEA
jgi:hypothetical protein